MSKRISLALFLMGLFLSSTKLLAQNATLVIPTAHTNDIQNIVVDRQNTFFYTRDEFKIIMWEVKTLRKLYTFNYINRVLTKDGYDGPKANRLARPSISPDGKIIALTTLQDSMKVYSTVTGVLIASIPKVYTAPAFSADSKSIYFIAHMKNAQDAASGQLVKSFDIRTGIVKDYWALPQLQGEFDEHKYFYPFNDGKIINFYERNYEVLDLDAKKTIVSLDFPETLKQKFRDVNQPLDKFNYEVFPDAGLVNFQAMVKVGAIAQVAIDILAGTAFSYTQHDLQISVRESFRPGNLLVVARSNGTRKQEVFIVGKGNIVEKKVILGYADEIGHAVLINKKNTLIYFGENNQLFKEELGSGKKQSVDRGLPIIAHSSFHRHEKLLSFAGSKYVFAPNSTSGTQTYKSFYTLDLSRAALTLQDTMPSKPLTIVKPLKINADTYLLQYEPIVTTGPSKFFFYNKTNKTLSPFLVNDFYVNMLQKEYNSFIGTPQMFSLGKPETLYYTVEDDIASKDKRYRSHLYRYNLSTKQSQRMFTAALFKSEYGKDWYDPFMGRPKSQMQMVLDQESGLVAVAENNFKGNIKIIDLKSDRVLASHAFAYDSTGFLENQQIKTGNFYDRLFKPHPFLIHQAKKTMQNTFRVMGNEMLYDFDLTSGKTSINKFTEFAKFERFTNIQYYGNNRLTSILVSYTDANTTVVKTIYGPQSFQLANISSPVKAIQFTQNDSTLYTINEDQTINAYNAISGKFYGTLYTFENTADWVFVGIDGRFDGNDGGMKRLYYVQNREVISLDKLFERFFTPNLFARLSAGENFAPIPPVRFKPKPITQIIYAERQRNLTVEDVQIVYINNTGSAEITVKASAPEDKIEEIRLFHNGKVASINPTRNLTVTDNDGVETKKYNISLLPGKNVFRAVSLNSQRTESETDEITINYNAGGNGIVQPPKNTPSVSGQVELIDKEATLHLMVVGINAYTQKINPLSYALPDATAFKNEIEKDAKSILSNVKTYFISDEKANSAGIKNALNQIKQEAKPKDVFIFYYAGHGYIHPDSKEFYLVGSDVTDAGQSLLQNGIPAKTLQDFAVDILAQKQVFILDACQSAGAYEKMMRHDGEQQKSLAVVSRSTGTHWIAASGSTETAKEFGQLGHGAFTYVLLQALQGQASANKMITVNGLKNFLQVRVPELVKRYGGNSQVPSSYGVGNDFPVEILK